ncbi:hypothetical protein OKW41_004871 [Paraburkholderia sp. UCT70]
MRYGTLNVSMDRNPVFHERSRIRSVAAHHDAGKRIDDHVVLADEPRKERAQHGERIRGERTVWPRANALYSAESRRLWPARPARPSQQRPVRDRIVGRERESGTIVETASRVRSSDCTRPALLYSPER